LEGGNVGRLDDHAGKEKGRKNLEKTVEKRGELRKAEIKDPHTEEKAEKTG